MQPPSTPTPTGADSFDASFRLLEVVALLLPLLGIFIQTVLRTVQGREEPFGSSALLVGIGLLGSLVGLLVSGLAAIVGVLATRVPVAVTIGLAGLVYVFLGIGAVSLGFLFVIGEETAFGDAAPAELLRRGLQESLNRSGDKQSDGDDTDE